MPTAPDNTTVRVRLDTVKDTESIQQIQAFGRSDERFGVGDYYVMRHQNYGFTTNPPQGSIGLLTALNGNPDAPIAHYVEHPDFRPRNTEVGASKMYGYQYNTDYIYIQQGVLTIKHHAKIRLESGSAYIEVTPDKITANVSGKYLEINTADIIELATRIIGVGLQYIGMDSPTVGNPPKVETELGPAKQAWSLFGG